MGTAPVRSGEGGGGGDAYEHAGDGEDGDGLADHDEPPGSLNVGPIVGRPHEARHRATVKLS
jgi:hypothetical protein